MGLATKKQRGGGGGGVGRKNKSNALDVQNRFYQCTKLENFWRNVKQYILISYDWRLDINEKVALFGVSKAEIQEWQMQKPCINIRSGVENEDPQNTDYYQREEWKH